MSIALGFDVLSAGGRTNLCPKNRSVHQLCWLEKRRVFPTYYISIYRDKYNVVAITTQFMIFVSESVSNEMIHIKASCAVYLSNVRYK